MRNQEKIIRILFIIGVVAFIIGALDPLEGSVVILCGSLLMAIASYFRKDRHKKYFISIAIMQLAGVFFLFYFSSLGGFGEGYLSWWWALLVIPYPIGWLMGIVLLIVRSIQKKPVQY